MTYRSQVRETLHDFGRPHASVRRSPIRGPAAWRGEDLARDSSWRERWLVYLDFMRRATAQ